MIYRFKRFIAIVILGVLVLNPIINFSREKKVQAIEINNTVEALVNNIYIYIHNRRPDETGFRYWVDSIQKGERSPETFVREVINSNEFIDKNYDNEAYISILYRAILGRDIDKSGFQYWTEQLKNGKYTKSEVIDRFLDSREFKNNWSKPIYIESNGEIGEFVDRYYKTLLGRQPDIDGHIYWINELRSEKITPAVLMYNGINSREFKERKYSSEEFLIKLYNAVLDRKPDKSGFDFWLNKICEGYSRNYILCEFIHSNEFKNLTLKYGFKSIGDIVLYEYDYPTDEIAYGITILNDIKLNIYEEPNLNSKWNVDIPSDTKVNIEKKIRGVGSNGGEDFYKISTVFEGKIYSGYIRTRYRYKDTVLIYSDNEDNSFLGILSEKYESGGDPGKISKGVDIGGKSYGAWQLSSTMGSVTSFVSWLKNKESNYYDRLIAAMVKDREKENTSYGTCFDEEWTLIAKEDYDKFYELQHEYMYIKYYLEAVRKLLYNDVLVEESLNSFAIRNVLWSTSVQHGVSGTLTILKNCKRSNDNKNIINNIYNERGRKNDDGTLVYFSKNPISVQDGVSKRFINECNEAILILEKEGK